MNRGMGVPGGPAATFGGAAKGALQRLLFATVAAVALGAGAARAETAGGALVKAYLNNPDINTQRAAVRVADENVPKANAGYLPNGHRPGQTRLPRAAPNSLNPDSGPMETASATQQLTFVPEALA